MVERGRVHIYRRSPSRYDGMYGDQLVVIALTNGNGWWAVEHIPSGKTGDVRSPHSPTDMEDRDAAAARAIHLFLSNR